MKRVNSKERLNRNVNLNLFFPQFTWKEVYDHNYKWL